VVRITKANYVKYEVELGSSRSSVSCRLRRTTSQAEICGLVAESKQDVCQRVCEVLLSDPRDEMTMGDSDFAYFAVVENLRVGLRSAVTNRFAGCAAARILCLGGDPEDVRYVFDRCNDTHTLGSDALVRAWIAGGLVSPPNPQAWQYLEQCLHKRYGPLATVTAAQALVVNGSSDAVRILGESCARQEVRKVLGSLVTELELLLPTLTSERFGSGFALAEDCLRELAYVMLVDDPRRRFAVETLKLYKDHDRAFARVRCSNDRHLSIHSVTLRWKDGRWFVVGIWPYAQSY
jgi:hypothetical protein